MKKHNKYGFKLIMIILILTYIFLYTAKTTDLIKINNKEIELTNKQIDEFENLIDNGEDLDLERYTVKKKDYSNFFSKMGYTFSNIISYIINDGLKETFSFVLKFFS